MSTLARFAPQLHFVPPSTAALNSLCTTNKVGALQSYSTIHGNAITVRFMDENNNSTSSSSSSSLLPLSNSLALSACESTVLELWFSELQKSRFGMHKHDYRVPLDAVKQKIGVINTCYHSVSPFMKKERRTPFAGSAEFSALPHREELNLSVTLWDEFKRPLSTTLWTGPKGKFGGGPMGVMISNDEVESEMKKLKRIPMQKYDESSFGNEDEDGQRKEEKIGANALDSSHSSLMSEENMDILFDELFSTSLPQSNLSSLKKTKNGGYSILAWGTQNNNNNNVSEVENSFSIMSSPAHDACVSQFATIVWKDIASNYFGVKESEEGVIENNVRIVAKTATLGAVVEMKPMEFRCAPPLFTPQLFTKSWEHKTGLPNLRGESCLALRIETIQGDQVVGVGTYYFTK